MRLMESQTICSLATGYGGYIVTVTLRARTTQSVPFVIIPMEIGTHSVGVVAVDMHRRSDGVRKHIVVLPAGIQRKTTVKLDINPSISGAYLTTVIGPWLVDVIDPIPNMPIQHIITAQAQPLQSRTEVGMIQSSESLTPLLTMRWGGGRRVGRGGGGGGGEQDLVAMTTPLVATYYLDHTHQLNDMRTQAVRSISLGYERLLACRKQDGSYSVTKTTRSSTWLTAYAAKLLSMASGIISVDGAAICSALLWLALNTQDSDGGFREHSPVPYTASITGNVYGRDKDASMTAFVLIAMQEAPSGLCTDKKISSSVSRAAHYLGLRIHTLTNPYAVAMATCALANEGPWNDDILFSHSSKGR
ncbi:complement C3-like [Engraulis encrasicolus]|uniref:complement C3-like n=1 Tax=Engraulis encrasicolus TaxID=184585 RepID=UPI002FCEB7CF